MALPGTKVVATLFRFTEWVAAGACTFLAILLWSQSSETFTANPMYEVAAFGWTVAAGKWWHFIVESTLYSWRDKKFKELLARLGEEENSDG